MEGQVHKTTKLLSISIYLFTNILLEGNFQHQDMYGLNHLHTS